MASQGGSHAIGLAGRAFLDALKLWKPSRITVDESAGQRVLISEAAACSHLVSEDASIRGQVARIVDRG